MNEQLLNYIKENLAKGVSQDQIRQTLTDTGWLQQDVDAAFSQLEPPQPITQSTQPLNPPKSFFSSKFLLIGILAVILLASAGGVAYFKLAKKTSPQTTSTNNSQPSEQSNKSIFDNAKNNNSSEKYSSCFSQFSESLMPQLSTYSRSPVTIEDPSPNQNPIELGAKKREISATYYKEPKTSLRANITEFVDHRAIEANISKLNDLEKNRSLSKIEFIGKKNIRGLETYFIKEFIKEVVNDEVVNENEFPVLSLISHPAETNIRIRFQFIPSIENKNDEDVFESWLKTVCP